MKFLSLKRIIKNSTVKKKISTTSFKNESENKTYERMHNKGFECGRVLWLIIYDFHVSEIQICILYLFTMEMFFFLSLRNLHCLFLLMVLVFLLLYSIICETPNHWNE